MGFGDILGQIMQQGLGGTAQPAGRVNQGLQNAGGGLDSILAQIQGALGGAGGAGGAGGGLGGMAEMAKEFLGKEQVGGLNSAQIGGIGAIAGALLGGGAGGAAKGGAMAVLGTIALSALKAAQSRAAAADAAPAAAPEDVAALAGPDTEKLMIAAMISAAKADGQIDETEMQKVIGKISANSVTDAEKQFVMDEMQAPIDIAALAAQVTSPAQAAAVYTASLLTINVDTDQEKAYLAELAHALKLDPATVSLLHQTTGVAA